MSIIASVGLIVGCNSPAENTTPEAGQIKHLNSQNLSESSINHNPAFATSGDLIGPIYDPMAATCDRDETPVLRTAPVSETARSSGRIPKASSAGRTTCR